MKQKTVTIEALWISPGHDFKGRHGQDRLDFGTHAVAQVECHAGRGLVGDRYYDFKPDYKGQVTLFAKEDWEAIVSHLDPSPDPSACRRNVFVQGLDLRELVGRRFYLGEVRFEGAEAAKPCYWMDQALGEGAFELLEGRGGLRCRVLESGVLRRGEVVCRLP